MYGSATEFGKFSRMSENEEYSCGSSVSARDKGEERPGHGYQAGTGGMKRKLFSEGVGPQLLD